MKNRANKTQRATRAREICRQGSFEKAYVSMKELGIMEAEVSKTKKLSKDELDKLYDLSLKDLEMLTIMRLFDSNTFFHSIETYITARKKIKRPLEGGVTFSELIEEEGLTIEQFYRACLFHDIGKLAIPKFLLNSNYTDENWAKAFIQLPDGKIRDLINKYSLDIPEDLLNDPEMLMEHMLRNRIRGARFVPIKTLFSKKQVKDLENKGFSENMSLIDIMQKHEKESGKILRFMGYAKEAEIAEIHHNYETANLNTQKHTCACLKKNKSVAAHIIHLADIHEALRSNRPYLLQRPILKTLAFMIDDAKKGLVDCRVVYLWTMDEIRKIDSAYLNLVMRHDRRDSEYEYLEDRKKELETIYDFLKKSGKPCQKK